MEKHNRMPSGAQALSATHFQIEDASVEGPNTPNRGPWYKRLNAVVVLALWLREWKKKGRGRGIYKEKS